MYKHTFVCLASTTQRCLPDQPMRSTLQLAGLGEKHLEMFLYGDADDLHFALLENFPRLVDGGGYELLRLNGKGGKELILIDMPSEGYTPEYLKLVISSAKIFVRPLQRNLKIEPIDRGSSRSVLQECQTCGIKLPMNEIKEHVEKSCSPADRPTDAEDHKNLVFDHASENSPITVEGPSDDIETEEDLVQYVLEKSREDCPPSSIVDIIRPAQTNLQSDEMFTFVVRRPHFLDDVLMQMDSMQYSPTKKIEVSFLGECGLDEGGLKREFLSMLPKAVSKRYMDCGSFRHDSVALQTDVFLKLGKLGATALVQGGSGHRIFSNSVFRYLMGKNMSEICVAICDIPDHSVKEMAQKITDATTVDDVRKLAGEQFDLLSSCGFVKPTSSISLDDRAVIVKALFLHHTLLQSKAEIDQYMEGLKALGVLNSIKQHATLLKPFFCVGQKDITADYIRGMLKDIKFSEQGSSAREREEATYMHFLRYLQNCEMGQHEAEEECEGKVTIRTIINFFTGAEEEPPMGWENCPVLNFNDDNPFPTASTCALHLTLPTRYYNDYKDLAKAMDVGFIYHGGFGLT